MNLDHLEWHEIGWGYLPPSDEVMTALRDVVDKCKPKSFLEIGFYIGHSTTYWREVLGPDVEMLSCYPKDHPRGDKAAKTIRSLFSNVDVVNIPSPLILIRAPRKQYDLIYVDGSHGYEDAFVDIMTALLLKPKYIMFDNYELDTVRKVVNQFYMKGHFTIDSCYNYESTFKGKTTTNTLTSVKVCDSMSL